jgi:small nuclear ribonucleoprotein (snRNP)-like protein
MAPAIEALNRHWLEPLAVELLLTDGRRLFGVFTGLDTVGNLRLLDEEEREFVVEHQLVERLKELF